jgi:hypothetical protein
MDFPSSNSALGFFDSSKSRDHYMPQSWSSPHRMAAEFIFIDRKATGVTGFAPYDRKFCDLGTAPGPGGVLDRGLAD